MTTQLNTTLGLTFDAERRFATLPLWPVRVAGVVIAFGLGFLSIRLRRLELAGTLHAGVAKSALGLQISIETASWALVGGLVGAVGCLWASMISNPDWPASISPGVRTLALCVLATLLGALLGLAMTRESQLFRYFRVR